MGPRISCVENSSVPGTAVWEVVDDKVMILANNYRYSLQQTWEKNTFLEIVKSILQLYIQLDLPRLIVPSSCRTIEEYFKEAYETEKVEPIIKAYTSTSTGFYRCINMDLANLVSTNDWRDILISSDAPEDRQYWEGALDFVCIIAYHPALNAYELKEEKNVFRGISISANYLDRFRVGDRLTNKTFLSTTVAPDVAEVFAYTGEERIGCLCIYTLVPSHRRTALQIKDISKVNDEEEILILPYTTFVVQSKTINTDPAKLDRYVIQLRQCPDFDNETNGSF